MLKRERSVPILISGLLIAAAVAAPRAASATPEADAARGDIQKSGPEEWPGKNEVSAHMGFQQGLTGFYGGGTPTGFRLMAEYGFRFHRLKIARTLLRDLPNDADDRAIVEAILALARSLGLEVVASGVETEGQRAFLEAHGCRGFQGYLFSRPLPPGEVEAYLDGG